MFPFVPFFIESPKPHASLVRGLDGMLHDPFKLAMGEPKAFIFVNHDCPICNAYSPEVNRIEKAFGGKVKVQLVFSEPNFTVADAKAYAKQFGLGPIETWIDDSRTFAMRCGATIVPEAILYDGRGEKVWDGRIDDTFASLGVRKQNPTTHDLRDALKLLVVGKRPKLPAAKPVGCIILTPDNS